jgi:8-oxo-dGTP pyrophosphatase MutT (NUDIX family)
LIKKTRYSGVLLLDCKGRFILQRRDNKLGIVNPGKLTTFGGSALDNESSIQCAIRELYEEVNLLISENDLIFLLKKTEYVDDRKVDCTIYIYRNVDTSLLSLAEGEAIEYVIPNQEIHNLNLSSLCSNIISKYMELHNLNM